MKKLLMLSMLALAGCASQPDVVYYTVQNPIPSNLLLKQSPPQCDVVVIEGMVDCLNAYDVKLQQLNNQLDNIKSWQNEINKDGVHRKNN